MITVKSCALGAALFFSACLGAIPGDSLKKRCVCEVYQALAEREYREGLRLPQHNVSKGMLKKKRKFDFLSSRNPKGKATRRKIKMERISRCWK